MEQLTVQNVYGLLLRSKLLPLDTARDLFQRWNTEAKENATNLTLFGKWLAAQQLLTEYQVNLLIRGHADGFFLNQYKILDRLGRGRMAGVYKAIHESGQVVAIKVLPPSKAKDPALLARFQREARLAIRLNHPNIVRAFQVCEIDGVHYFVMEHLDGETLEEVLQRRGKFPPAEAVRLIHQSLLGLQHIHEQGLVHRDLKPSNLMLIAAANTGSGDSTLGRTVKILDMGLGRTLFDEHAPVREREEALTTEGVLLGTPDYMAPEQARDPRTIDVRADIYSLGCVLYHLLAGQLPFPDTNIISQMIRHATEVPKPLQQFNPAVPEGLQQIVNWMMAKDPAQRYPTPERAAQALQIFLAAGADPVSIPADADPKLKKYLTWLEVEDPSRVVVAAPAKPATPATPPASAPTVPVVTVPIAPGLPVKSPSSDKMPAAAKQTSKHSKADLKRRLKKQNRPETPTPTAAAAQPAVGKPVKKEPEFDVELVVLPTPSPIPTPTPAVRVGRPVVEEGSLTGRDFIAFAIGGGCVPLAIFFGWILANLANLELVGRDFVFFALGIAVALLVGSLGLLLHRRYGVAVTKRWALLRERLKKKPVAAPTAPEKVSK